MSEACSLHLGFTGTRQEMTSSQRFALRRWLRRHTEYSWFHHGMCKGSDFIAGEIAKELGLQVWGHPPIKTEWLAPCKVDRKEEPLEYLARNRAIVDSSFLLLGTPYEQTEQLRSGTWATIRYARQRRKPFVLFMPDGREICG